MSNSNFTFRDRLKSFGYAFNGLRLLFINEYNAWVHLVACTCVVIAGFLLKISLFEWAILIIVIGVVFALEAINSSIEKLSDFISPGKNEQIKAVKDLAAAGVLISAITAFIVGLLIFIPKVVALLRCIY